jgi:hypothetical protein
VLEVKALSAEGIENHVAKSVLADTTDKGDIGPCPGSRYRLVCTLAAHTNRKTSAEDRLAPFRGGPHICREVDIGITDDNKRSTRHGATFLAALRVIDD